MNKKKYILIPNATATEVEKFTGLKGINTPEGVLIEDTHQLMSSFEMKQWVKGIQQDWNSIFNKPRCKCGMYSLIHQPNCPEWSRIT